MYQYERNTKLNMKFKDAFDVRETNKAVLEFVDDHIDINIPAYKGDRGEKGDPGPSPVYQYSVASVGDLAAIAEGLTEAEEGYWYGVDGSSSGWIWNGRDLVERENFIGQKGDKGDMPNLVGGTFSSGPTPGGSIEEVSPGNYRINVISQKGDKGDKGDRGATGPAASIASAADFAAALGVAAGDVVVRKADGTYTTGAARCPRVYSISHQSFSQKTVPPGTVTDNFYVARLDIPGLPWAWRPSVSGVIYVSAAEGTRIDTQVRMTAPPTGTVSTPPPGTQVGYGQTVFSQGYDFFSPCVITTDFDQAGVIGPESPVGVVPANTPMSFFVVPTRVYGSSADQWVVEVGNTRPRLEIACVPA